MFIYHLWGDVWVAEKSDNIWLDILIKLFLTLCLIAITTVVVLTVVGGVYLYKAIKEKSIEAETANSVQKTQATDQGKTARQLLACPNCGNTRSLDINPCIRCGKSFKTIDGNRMQSVKQ